MTKPESDRQSGGGFVSLVVFVYVLPVLFVAGLLALAGLRVLAVALGVIEAVVSVAVVLAKRAPVQLGVRAEPSRRPWLVPLIALAIPAVIAGGTALFVASRR